MMMQRLVSFLLLLLPAVMGAKYDGMFKLLSAQDPEQGNVPIPGDFNLVIRPEGETRYAVSFRIGNSLRGEMAVTEGVDGAPDSLHFGDIMSTMMMPPENIFRLEQFLTSNLPKMSTIFFTDDEETKLTMEGEATIKFEKA